MDRKAFLAQSHVTGFIAWLVDRLPTLPVSLRFLRSKFVPDGIDVQVEGIESVHSHYCWRTSWIDRRTGQAIESDNWESTRMSLEQLSAWLRASVASGDEQAAGAAAREVLRWGGVRGAIPFIESKVRQNALCRYLGELASLFTLDGQHRLDALHAGNVQRFDAGLTKVHALLDVTGSPIYDSRVGAALAMLYELFRRDAERDGIRHGRLSFPSGQARGLQIRDPGDFGFAPAPQFYTNEVAREDWARWQLRAGWIIRAVLEETTLFVSERAGEAVSHIAARCHAFEAALFMLGYDLRCLIGDRVAPVAKDVDGPPLDPEGGGNWVPTSHPFSTVLSVYNEYRETLPADPGADGFANWLRTLPEEERCLGLKRNFRSYTYPFREREFNLFDRSPDEIRLIEQGGEDGLYAANNGEREFIAGDEREKVCLVCAGLAGYCQQIEATPAARKNRLTKKAFAGTEKSASTLLSVGRSVGRHFGLLDDNDNPTALFHRFFGDDFSDFRDRLGIDRDGRDTDPR
ncbi:hypothetical protein [Trinickia violacea]|uniref:hypothetical protein n=1 Tax=Trinickia violacea TaxID=2571746 RepID=UPI0015866FEA|nr:hypothetical protein [Trinickia violacea]